VKRKDEGLKIISRMVPLDYFIIRKIIEESLKEDIFPFDLTTESLNLFGRGRAVIVSKEKGVIAGLPIAREVFKFLDPTSCFKEKKKEGEEISEGEIVAEIEADIRAILKGERVALNFLQRLSGIATLTRKYVEKIKGTGVTILDTRKTPPGLRHLDKYAVRIGGGKNHRFNLGSGILIKDNHIKAAGGIRKAVKKIRENIGFGLKIEVETKKIEEVEEALQVGADIILLDNMSFEEVKEAVKMAKGKARIEVSGGVNLNNVREYAKLGPDFISVGELTHSPKAFDLSLELIDFPIPERKAS